MMIPVILSGGAGTRLWPVSRESHPKPFIKLPDGKTLLHKTYERACSLNNISNIITITNKEYYLKCKLEYDNLASNDLSHHFLLEPASRNTAPAIIFAALNVYLEHGADAVLLVLPADHLISDLTLFKTACETAYQLANSGKITTFGIKPVSPETGFGYIECGNSCSIPHTFDVKQFIEKPDKETAERYMQSPHFFWNSGMFCFNVKRMLDELSIHAPLLLQSLEHCFHETNKKNAHSIVYIDNSFNDVQSISIDYALMEKSKEVGVVTCDFDWQDIGSWKAYKNLHEQDENGNTVLGQAILIDSQDNFIHSEGRMIASVGINNLFVIDTPDALLISHRDRSQEVTQVVQTLKKTNHDSYMHHRTTIRPWGSYTVLEEGHHFKIKRIVIKPHASLSLQSHQFRSEHWVVVQGTATIINGDKEYSLQKNESTFVPVNTLHRVSNLTNDDLIIIEVQSGDYVGEDDIVRYEDTYGRDTISFGNS